MPTGNQLPPFKRDETGVTLTQHENAHDFPTARMDSELSLGRDSAKTFADENFGGW